MGRSKAALVMSPNLPCRCLVSLYAAVVDNLGLNPPAVACEKKLFDGPPRQDRMPSFPEGGIARGKSGGVTPTGFLTTAKSRFGGGHVTCPEYG